MLKKRFSSLLVITPYGRDKAPVRAEKILSSLSSSHCRPSIHQPKAGTQDDNGFLLHTLVGNNPVWTVQRTNKGGKY
jgi:hypothetical protein